MDNRNILLEDIGLPVAAIDSIVLQTNDALAILLGEKNGQTKYPISFSEISHNKVAQQILSEIARNVDWSTSIRENTDVIAQCRYVFLAASIIPSLARKLLEMARQYNGQQAKVVQGFFEQLCGFHSDTRLATGKTGRLNHEFATIADHFYSALLGAMEICTKTRKQTSVDSDYGASAKVHQLWGYIGSLYKTILDCVEQMMAAAGIECKPDDYYVNHAAAWLLAYMLCRKQLFGAEYNNTKKYAWRDLNASITEQLYDIVRYGWQNITVAKADKSANFVDLSDDANVIKDMDHLGDNTSQLNIVNDLTKFTCQQYYKVFAVDGLRSYDFKKASGRLVYLIMLRMMNDIGRPYKSVVNDSASASQFADYVRDFFAEAATNTKKASIVHKDLLTAFNTYQKLYDLYSEDKAKFTELYTNTYRFGSVKDDTEKNLKDALNAIVRTIVFSGDNSIQGTTVNNEKISFTKMVPEVATFGIYSTNDRKQTMDLSTAGTITAKCFQYVDNTLTISFNGSDDDGNPGNVLVDTIPLDTIRKRYDSYISSRLLPAHISNAYAWIVLCGLVAFSPVTGGDLDDSVFLSDVIRSHMSDVAEADVYKNTRISDVAKRANMLSRSDLTKWMLMCNFIPAAAKDNLDAKIQVSQFVASCASDEYLKNKIIATKNLCQEFSKAVHDYADECAAKDVVDKSSIVSRLYDVSPSMYELVLGKKSAIDSMLLKFVAHNAEDTADDTAAYPTLCAMMIAYEDLASSSVDKNFYLLLSRLTAMLSVLNKKKAALPQSVALDLDKVFEAVGQSYTEVQQKISALYNECIHSENKGAYASAHREDIVYYRDVVVDALHDQYDIWASCVQEKLDSKISGDADVEELRDRLYKIVDDMSNGGETRCVEPADILRLNNNLAMMMYGDDMVTKKETLRNLTVPQYGVRVKVIGALLYAAGQAESPNKIGAGDEASDDVTSAINDEEIELAEGGDEAMPEVTWMSPENTGGVLHHMTVADANDEVDKAMSFDNLPFNDTYIKEMMTLCHQFQETEEKLDSLKQKVNKMRTIALNLPGASSIPPDDHSYQTALKVYVNDDSINPSLKARAERNVKQLELTEAEYDEISNAVDDFQNKYPSYAGLVSAIENHDVSFDEVKYALSQLSNAKEQLATLVKYKSYTDAANDSNRREFAYTESDFSTIAQIIDVLGTYLITPQDSNDNVYDLLDVLNNMSSAITKYSGNKLSLVVIRKAIHAVTSAIENANQNADKSTSSTDNSIVAVSIVKLINQLGRLLVTREPVLTDSQSLSKIGHISRPQGTGAAIDSFARSQLRALPANEKEKIKTFGQRDTDEKAARTAYVDLLKRDMSSNPELSKYAYMLGNAFNAFDRVMKDVRVSGKEDRAFNDVVKSFTGIGLFGNMCDNDLQREVISAIIDDERENDKSYPTVTTVITAAKNAKVFNTYSQMYKTSVGSRENILHDQKNVVMAFDENGNRTTPEHAVPLDATTISELVVGKVDGYVVPFNDIPELVRLVRMSIFRKLTSAYGEMDVFSEEFKYSDKKVNMANQLLTEALKSLYRLCKDTDTPIADIIMASQSAGQKAARYSVMSYVKDNLGQDADLDLSLVGMVSDEPDVFPEMMSNEMSEADTEWISGITELFSQIPDSIDPNTLYNVVVEYMRNQASRDRLAMNDDYRVVMSVIEKMFKLDTATGIPTGFWGDDSTDRRKTIIALFEELIRVHTGDNDTWAKAAEAVGDAMIKSIAEEGRVDLAVGSRVFPSMATKRRLGHLRMNPYYAVDLSKTYVDEYKKLVDKLTAMKVIVKNGSLIKLKYPGVSLDRNTFGYIVKMAVNWEDVIDGDIVERFFLALMCYISGIRVKTYLSMELVAENYKSKIDYDALNKASAAIKSQYDVVDYGEMVKTSLGWFTGTAYRVLCIIAMLSKGDVIKGFADAVNQLTDGGTRSLDIKDILKRRKTKKKKDAKKKKDNTSGEGSTDVPVDSGSTESPVPPETEKTPEVNPAPLEQEDLPVPSGDASPEDADDDDLEIPQ